MSMERARHLVRKQDYRAICHIFQTAADCCIAFRFSECCHMLFICAGDGCICRLCTLILLDDGIDLFPESIRLHFRFERGQFLS